LYQNEIYSLKLREECGMRMSENKVVGRIFVPEEE
jgi:hypothetical protein